MNNFEAARFAEHIALKIEEMHRFRSRQLLHLQVLLQHPLVSPLVDKRVVSDLEESHTRISEKIEKLLPMFRDPDLLGFIVEYFSAQTAEEAAAKVTAKYLSAPTGEEAAKITANI